MGFCNGFGVCFDLFLGVIIKAELGSLCLGALKLTFLADGRQLIYKLFQLIGRRGHGEVQVGPNFGALHRDEARGERGRHVGAHRALRRLARQPSFLVLLVDPTGGGPVLVFRLDGCHCCHCLR